MSSAGPTLGNLSAPSGKDDKSLVNNPLFRRQKNKVSPRTGRLGIDANSTLSENGHANNYMTTSSLSSATLQDYPPKSSKSLLTRQRVNEAQDSDNSSSDGGIERSKAKRVCREGPQMNLEALSLNKCVESPEIHVGSYSVDPAVFVYAYLQYRKTSREYARFRIHVFDPKNGPDALKTRESTTSRSSFSKNSNEQQKRQPENTSKRS